MIYLYIPIYNHLQLFRTITASFVIGPSRRTVKLKVRELNNVLLRDLGERIALSSRWPLVPRPGMP